MIILVQDGEEIFRLVCYMQKGIAWWTAYNDKWGQATTSLESHLLHLGNYFPKAKFVFVP